jgi:hypothetical protein
LPAAETASRRSATAMDATTRLIKACILGTN